MSDRLGHERIESILRELEKPRGEMSGGDLHHLVDRARSWMSMERFVCHQAGQPSASMFDEAAAAISAARRLRVERDFWKGVSDEMADVLLWIEDNYPRAYENARAVHEYISTTRHDENEPPEGDSESENPE